MCESSCSVRKGSYEADSYILRTIRKLGPVAVATRHRFLLCFRKDMILTSFLTPPFLETIILVFLRLTVNPHILQ